MWKIVIIFIILLLFIPFNVNVKLKKINSNVSFKIIILLFAGFLKWGIDIPELMLTKRDKDLIFNFRGVIGYKKKKTIPKKEKFSVKKLISKLDKVYENRNKFKIASMYLSRKIKIKKLIWITEIGLGDAALNGIICGFLWIIKSIILSGILNNRKYEKVDVNVKPNYTESTLKINFDCIIELKLVYIINAGIYGLKALIKGGE